MSRWKIHGIALLAIATSLCATCVAETGYTAPNWDKETIDMFAHFPVQDNGRIKPLDTYAAFTLMQLNGRRTCINPAGEKTTAIVWLMDCLFRPDQAVLYKVFRVENSEAITSIGLQPKRKRDYYSYEELLPAREKLMTMGKQFSEKENRQCTSVEKEIMGLAINLRVFESLVSYARFSLEHFDITLKQVFDPELIARIYTETGTTFSKFADYTGFRDSTKTKADLLNKKALENYLGGKLKEAAPCDESVAHGHG